MDPKNPRWGWSWLERWMAARPWENKGVHGRELNSDYGSVKSATSRAISVGELSSKAHPHRDQNPKNKPSPAADQKPILLSCRQSPSTPPSKTPSVASRIRPASPKGSSVGGGDDESRSMLSCQSEWYRRHSVAGSLSVRDDESLASSPAVPSYMAPTKSAKAKSRLPSPLGNGASEKGSMSSAKKRLSFATIPAGTRRHSGPPRVDTTGSVKDINVH